MHAIIYYLYSKQNITLYSFVLTSKFKTEERTMGSILG